MNDQPRIILALAAEADDTFMWDRLRTLQTEMFAAGPIAIRFAYYGPEAALETRPLIATRWVTDPDDMGHLMDHARTNCRCGCFIQTGDILEQALRETRQGPVQAVVVVGDSFHGDLEDAVATAKQLRAAGTRLFCFSKVARARPRMGSGRWPK